MEINSYFIAAAKPKAVIDVSRCPVGFCILANGRVIHPKSPGEERLLILHLATLIKKPVVGC